MSMKTETLGAALLLFAGLLCADELQMSNGDRYVGKIVSLDTNAVVLESDVLGTVRLARSKVASINLGTQAPAQVTQSSTITNRLPRVRVPTTASSAPVTATSI